MKKELIKYLKSLGIEVYTNTKARGHQGFFLKNRIDISKNTKEERIIPTLLHEFAHFIHNKIEPDMTKTGGSLELLFAFSDGGIEIQPYTCLCEGDFPEAIQEGTFFGLPRRNSVSPRNDDNPSTLRPFNLSTLRNELLAVTHFVDENSLCHKLYLHKEQIKEKIKTLENQIKKDYPNFMRSKKFKEFDKYIKKSKAKYLLRYDRVKFVSPNIFKLLRKVEILSIDNIERDFPEMPRAFCAYIRLKSAQKKQARISKRINSLNKYYSKPTELFSRFVEGLYINREKTRQLAPFAYEKFFELLYEDYYFELKEVLEMFQIDCEAAVI